MPTPGGSRDDFCFVHAADLHLGGRLWLRSTPPDTDFAQRVRMADLMALKALVDLCLAERAKFLLCAGDVIDGWCRDYRVSLQLVHELLRLRDAHCQVSILLGNHDVRTRLMKPLLLPEYAHLIGVDGPETRLFEDFGLALHGWSFPEPEAPVDIAALYPEPLAGLLNIGLLHTSAEGRRGHANYAPCSRRTLRHKGYDYWALGHVHTREVIAREPWIVFPGNLQARGPREAGAKGATLVRVSAGRIASVEHRALDVVRFATLVADTSHADHFDDVLLLASASLRQASRGADGRPVIARLILSGAAGAACALAVPPWQRAHAFDALARQMNNGALWLDETWIDAGVVAGSWLVRRAA